MNGFLNMLKPPGMTSHDLVVYARRRLGVRKVGHTGTLDPAAAGVLVLTLGSATRLSEYLQETTKGYRTEIMVGTATDSGDVEGRVTGSASAAQITTEQVEAALAEMVGEVTMRPPKQAAVRLGGRRMYELARAGEEFEPPQRTVQVYEMELLEYVPGLQALVRVEISCSKGTYVRSLARMLGERLGCGAHLSALLRTRVGPHSLQDSILPEELPEAAADHLIGLAEGLPDMPRVVVSEEQAQRLAHGGAVPLAGAPPPPPTEPCAVLDPGGSLICIASLSAGRPAALEPRKVLV